jgi:ribosomal-protein-alanine N-acetyltransferase
VNLIEIPSSGPPIEELGELPAVAIEAGAAYLKLYNSVGFVRPWLGYFGRQDSLCIGTCGFKGPPQNNRVEIAYFTFPGYEGRGYATRMAGALINLAWETEAQLIIAAQTLPVESASTWILRKLGFALVGSVNHPEDGKVWEWQLPNHTEGAV